MGKGRNELLPNLHLSWVFRHLQFQGMKLSQAKEAQTCAALGGSDQGS